MQRSKRLVLSFHGLGSAPRDLDNGEDAYWLEPTTFERILDEVAGRDDVLVTFDDGNASDVEIALPALERRGLTGAFFVLVGKLDENGYLSSGDVRTLVTSGMTVGTHGMEHRAWTSLDDLSARVELADARRALEDLARCRITMAALPFGKYDRQALRRLKAHEYEVVFTTDGGWTDASAWLQSRNTIRRDDSLSHVRSLLARGETMPVRVLRSVKLMAKRWR
jgi:peptidoglycan/xylan/chitin deacetylase (PgdA/CDA1 family)